MTAVLGIKCGPQHDTGAAVVFEDAGQLKCIALSEERLTRKKQSRSFPELSIQACLDAANLKLSEVDLVCLDKLGRHTMTESHLPIGQVPEEAWKAPESEFFQRAAPVPVVVVNHHAAHAATAFCVHQMPEAACLIVDGAGSDYPLDESPHRLISMGALDEEGEVKLNYYDRRAETQSIFHAVRASDGTIRLQRKATSTRSGIGHFYSFFSRHCLGFGHLQEGKAMGLAAWGDPQVAAKFPQIPAEVFTGVDTLVLDHLMAIEHSYRKRVSDPPTDEHFAARAFWMQEVLNQAIAHLSKSAIEMTGSRNLCVAGGVALNVVANRLVRNRLMGAGSIDDMFVQPASSDAGIPLGAALYGYYVMLGEKLPFQKNIVYLGPEPNQSAAEELIVSQGGRISDNLISEVADLLLGEKIVGWWQGRSEYGPRALGARSILCWPHPPGMKDHLNLRVKHREAFRPFAPIVREESASRIFDADFPVPYMLFNTQIRPEYSDKIPAVAHVDGSGRLQTVSRDRVARLYDLLGEVENRDGVGVLLNTSFNDAGEPIVESAEDAISCFRRTGLDAVVCGNAILLKD